MSSQNYETIFGNLPRSANFTIVGFFDIGMYEYDTSLIFMPINLLQNFLDNNGRIEHYEIIVENFNNLESTQIKPQSNQTNTMEIEFDKNETKKNNVDMI